MMSADVSEKQNAQGIDEISIYALSNIPELNIETKRTDEIPARSSYSR